MPHRPPAESPPEVARLGPALTRRAWLRQVGALALATAAPAWALVAPTGPVVLSVDGRVRNPNRALSADFDIAMLAALPQHTIACRTPWFRDARRFTGPLVRTVLDTAGADGQTLRLGALNDYHVDVPFSDVVQHDVIVARLLDDQPMGVRDKGPLFVMYPFDSEPQLRSAIYFSRSVWQLRTIRVS